MASFSRQLMRVARGKGEFIGLGRDDARATVGSCEIPAGFQHGKIAPNGGNGRIDVLGNLFQRRKFNLLEIFSDSMLALFCLHSGTIMKDFERFCKIYVDNYVKTVKTER